MILFYHFDFLLFFAYRLNQFDFLIIGLLGELIFPLIGEKKRYTFIDAFQNYSKTKKKSAKDYIKAVDKLSEDMDKIERINRPLTIKIKDFFDEYKTYIILFIILSLFIIIF